MTPLLLTRRLVAGYGDAAVLAGIDLTLEEGQTAPAKPRLSIRWPD